MSTVDITVDQREADRILDQVARAGTLPETTRRVGEAAEQLIRGTFRSSTDPWGRPWPPLSPITVAARRNRGSASTQPLVDQNVMYASLDSVVDGDSAVVSMAGRDRWPSVQQFGNAGNRAWGRGSAPIPARPMFPIRNAQTADIPTAWWPALTEPLRRALEAAAR